MVLSSMKALFCVLRLLRCGRPVFWNLESDNLLGFLLYGARFYTECFGMKLLRKRDIPEEKYSNAFLGFGPEESHFVVELTYSMFFWG